MAAPIYGSAKHLHQARTSAAEELTEAPSGQLLGSIPTSTLLPPTEERPPWETDPNWHRHNSDARRYVTVPVEWELRWLNPRLIEEVGLRDWRILTVDNDRVKIKPGYDQMVSPEHYVRRGGPNRGDLLAYMPRSWVESRQREKALRNARATQGAKDRAEQTAERINRGEFGPNVAASIKHPTHTTGVGLPKDD